MIQINGGNNELIHVHCKEHNQLEDELRTVMLAYVGVVRVRHGRVEAVSEEGKRPVVPDRVPGGEGRVQRPVHHTHLHPVGGVPLLHLTCKESN